MKNIGDKVGITGEIVGVEKLNDKVIYKVSIPDYYTSFDKLERSSNDKILVPENEIFDI